MIDFTNATYVKLAPRDVDDAVNELSDILIEGERVELAFKGARDSVTFTTRRIVALNIQGMTGSKRDYTSLPYGKIQSFAVETAGTFDRESELELWFSGLGKVRFEFSRGSDIRGVYRLIGQHAL